MTFFVTGAPLAGQSLDVVSEGWVEGNNDSQVCWLCFWDYCPGCSCAHWGLISALCPQDHQLTWRAEGLLQRTLSSWGRTFLLSMLNFVILASSSPSWIPSGGSPALKASSGPADLVSPHTKWDSTLLSASDHRWKQLTEQSQDRSLLHSICNQPLERAGLTNHYQLSLITPTVIYAAICSTI